MKTSEPAGREQRREPRQTMKGTTVLCYTTEFTGNVYDQYNVAMHLVDVSKIGACIVTVGRLRPGVTMMLDLTFPRTQDHLKAKATVRWSDSIIWRNKDVHIAGLEFVRLLQSTPTVMTLLSGGAAKVTTKRVPVPKGTPSRDPRRLHPRFSIETTDVICCPTGLLALVGVGGNSAQALVNLSPGGCQIACSRQLKPEATVRLRIRIKQFGDIIEGTGKVCWSKMDTVSWKPRWLAGIRFCKLTKESQSVVTSLARWYQSYSKA